MFINRNVSTFWSCSNLYKRNWMETRCSIWSRLL